MEKRKDILTALYHDIIKYGEVLERIQKGEATEKDKIDVKEFVWTIVSKEVIIELLSNLPMQQKEFAEKINVTPAMITAYKNGRKLPSIPTFFMIMSELHPEVLNAMTDGKLTTVNEMLKSLNIDLKF